MKILHLIGGGDVGGAKTHVISLLSGLREQGEDVRLLSFRSGDFSEDATAAGIPVHVTTGGFIKDIRMIARMAKDYDILHCHGARGNTAGMLVGRRLDIPVVTTVHSDYRLDYMGRPLAALTYGGMNRIALRRMDYYVGVSDVMSQTLVKRGFPAERIYTIYNGLDFTGTPSAGDREADAKAIGVDYEPDAVYAGIAVRFDPVKDLATLVRAAAALRESCPKLRILIAGDGKQREMLEKLVASLNAPVQFLGWLPGTESFFRLIDINLLTSLSETFPYALTEGTRMGCATIASSVGGVPILIDHGINGLLFPPKDVEALAECIAALYHDPDKCRDMGQRLRVKAAREFSIEATLRRQMEIYQSVLSRHRRPRHRRDGVTLCGAYGMDNAGDDAILEAILQEIRDEDPDIPVRILSRSPLETQLTYREHAFHSFNVFAFARALLRSDVYLSGGGNLVQDVTSRRSLWFYLFTIVLAKKLGCRVVMYGCGVGPVNAPFNRRLTASVLERYVDIITLREETSLHELELMKVQRPEIILTADPALILEPADEEKVDSLLLRQGIPLGGDYIGLSLRNWIGLEEKLPIIVRAVEHVYRTYGLTPVFVPIERKQDLETANKAASMVECPCYVLRNTGSARATIGILGRMRMVVAMRLHALIFAAGQGLPMVGIAYNEKVNAFMEYMGQKLCTRLSDLEYDHLIAQIAEAFDSENDRERRLQSVLRLREREEGNRAVMKRMIARDGGDSLRSQTDGDRT